MKGATPPTGRVAAQATAPPVLVAVYRAGRLGACESAGACTDDLIAESAVGPGEGHWAGRWRWGRGLGSQVFGTEPGGGGPGVPAHHAALGSTMAAAWAGGGTAHEMAGPRSDGLATRAAFGRGGSR